MCQLIRKALVDKPFSGLVDAVAPRCCAWCRGPAPSLVGCPACRDALPWRSPACRACAAPLPEPAFAAGQTACGDCLVRAPPFDTALAAFAYAPPVDGLVIALKFESRLWVAALLGEALADRAAAAPGPLPDLLVPVPLHAGRLRRRGYNQALEIAREAARHLRVPLHPRLAARTRATPEQTHLDAAARRRNLRGAFRVDAAVRGRHVALVDDVMTTGATLGALARAARKAGAARVSAWVAARA